MSGDYIKIEKLGPSKSRAELEVINNISVMFGQNKIKAEVTFCRLLKV